MLDMTAVITAREVTRAYRGDGTVHPAVRGVSLEVQRGEFVAIMGQSGSGKSTLLNLLGGIDRPDAGEVWVEGVRLDRASETQLAKFRRRHVGIVFQFFNLIHNLDVMANIELPALLAGQPARAVRERARELLAAVDLTHVAHKMPGQLSGGQRQRVAICRALINRPAVLLADEPTGALDLESGLAVMRLFRQVHSDGQTIVMVTHDAKVAGHAGRILTMQDGRIVAETRPSAEAGSRLAEMLLGKRGTTV
jgi:putative ABC transport system ATP-binding protein